MFEFIIRLLGILVKRYLNFYCSFFLMLLFGDALRLGGAFQIGRFQIGRFQVGRFQIGRFQVPPRISFKSFSVELFNLLIPPTIYLTSFSVEQI